MAAARRRGCSSDISDGGASVRRPNSGTRRNQPGNLHRSALPLRRSVRVLSQHTTVAVAPACRRPGYVRVSRNRN